jgi:hypothetical protein
MNRKRGMRAHAVWASVFVIVLVLLTTLLVRTVMAADRAQTTSAAQREDAAAAGAFEAMVPVLRHPRCMNCHSKGDFPRQGDDGHPHAMNVRRGPDGHGVTAQKCSTCHQEQNLAGLNMPPGAHDWHLPPANMPMIWEGLTNRQLCELFKDPKQNGNRTQLAQLVEHMETPLVKWGWNPGEGRTPIPGSHDAFMTHVKQWVGAGGACPAS